MYVCPHCSQRGISFWARAGLGPHGYISCKICGGRIGVPFWKSYAAMIPAIAGVILMTSAENYVIGIGALVLGYIAWLILFFRWVPMIKEYAVPSDDAVP